MLSWAIICLVVSLLAGALGFSGLARDSAALAKFFFGLFLLVSLIIFVLVLFGVGAVAAGSAVIH